jgi:hypothetical protein
MNHASCLCKSVQFTIDCELRSARFCYCANCTKFAGTSPAIWAMAKRSKIEFSTSDKSISKFDSGKGLRCFCTTCGSPVWFESLDYPQIIAIPLGVIDDGELPPAEMHIWVRSKRGWCAIVDDLPQYETNPRQGNR